MTAYPRIQCPRCLGSGQIPSPTSGLVFKRQRRAKKLSLREVSRRAKVTPGYLSRLENGLQPWQGAAAHRVQHVLEDA